MFGKYADLGFFHNRAEISVLTKHGLSIMQLPDNIDGKPALTTIVMHTSGQFQKATTPLLIEKETAQGYGSALTYTRRYGYAAALQIVIDEDDDGNKASAPKTAQTAQTAPKKPESNLATDKQRKLISDKLFPIGYTTPDEIKNYLSTEYGINGLLTKTDADTVISDLMSNESEDEL